jgi:hypothetical protein
MYLSNDISTMTKDTKNQAKSVNKNDKINLCIQSGILMF